MAGGPGGSLVSRQLALPTCDRRRTGVWLVRLSAISEVALFTRFARMGHRGRLHPIADNPAHYPLP